MADIDGDTRSARDDEHDPSDMNNQDRPNCVENNTSCRCLKYDSAQWQITGAHISTLDQGEWIASQVLDYLTMATIDSPGTNISISRVVPDL